MHRQYPRYRMGTKTFYVFHIALKMSLEKTIETYKSAHSIHNLTERGKAEFSTIACGHGRSLR
jgi:hypothetical protein